MSLLTAESVSFHYPDHARAVVRSLSLTMERGKLIRISGRNGSGKTTALRLLAGELTPTSGELRRSPKGKALYLDQKAPAILASDLTIGDHIRAFRHGDRASELSSELTRFGLPLQTLVPKFAGQLSGGERQLFALLCALGGRYSVLLLDEFTSHLDDRSEVIAFDLVGAALASKLVGVVLVSHRAVPLRTDETISLEMGGGDDRS